MKATFYPASFTSSIQGYGFAFDNKTRHICPRSLGQLTCRLKGIFLEIYIKKPNKSSELNFIQLLLSFNSVHTMHLPGQFQQSVTSELALS